MFFGVLMNYHDVCFSPTLAIDGGTCRFKLHQNYDFKIWSMLGIGGKPTGSVTEFNRSVQYINQPATSIEKSLFLRL